jgi:hypothetical protein
LATRRVNSLKYLYSSWLVLCDVEEVAILTKFLRFAYYMEPIF